MSKKSHAGLGNAEAEILNIVWAKGSATVQQIWEALPPSRPIAQATVQSVLRRLRDKGFVKSEVQGRAHVFSAAAKPKAVIRQLVQRFIRNLFGGDPMPLLMHLAEHKDVSPEDLKKLRDMVEQSDTSKENDDKKRKHR